MTPGSAIHAAALYIWLVMLVVRFVPIVGVKHKHRGPGSRLNSRTRHD